MPDQDGISSAYELRPDGLHELSIRMPRPVTQAGDVEQLTAALESTCGTLVMLESVRSYAPDPTDEVRTAHRHLADATASLRSAIAEMRALRMQSASTLGLGFVLAAPEHGRDQGRAHPQRSVS